MVIENSLEPLDLEPLWADQGVNEIGQQAERDGGAENEV
jgi:hypothetical protein